MSVCRTSGELENDLVYDGSLYVTTNEDWLNVFTPSFGGIESHGRSFV